MKKIWLALALIIIFAGTANAENEFYLGGGVGATFFKSDYYSGDKGVTGKLFGGWRYSKYSSLEVGLHSFGSYYIAPAYGFSSTLLGIYPISDSIEIFGKGGFLVSVFDTLYSIEFNGTGIAPIVGAGLNYKIMPELSLRLEYEYAPDWGIDLGIKSTTASVIWHF